MERRRFLHGGAALGISAVLHGLELAPARARQGGFTSDVDVLNFVLAVTLVQSALYELGNEAEVVSGDAERLLVEIAADERAQIPLLRERIQEFGRDPVDPPELDVEELFEELFEDRDEYLEAAVRVENAAVQGFLGLLPAITDPEVLELVAGIYGVEARHAALVADLADGDAEGGVFRGPQERSTGTDEVAEELSEVFPEALPEGFGPSPSPEPTPDGDAGTPAPSSPTPTPQPTPTPKADPTPPPTPRPTATPEDGLLP